MTTTENRLGRVAVSHRLAELYDELEAWTTGHKSHTNEFMSVEDGPAQRTRTLMHIAQADAAEVAKLSAAIQALVTLGGRVR